MRRWRIRRDRALQMLSLAVIVCAMAGCSFFGQTTERIIVSSDSFRSAERQDPPDRGAEIRIRGPLSVVVEKIEQAGHSRCRRRLFFRSHYLAYFLQPRGNTTPLKSASHLTPIHAQVRTVSPHDS